MSESGQEGVPEFLTRLGLDLDAEPASIRRAYARELKKIDQEADPKGFQQLREAYEIALHWAAHQAFIASLPTAEEDDATEDAGGEEHEGAAPLPPAAPVSLAKAEHTAQHAPAVEEDTPDPHTLAEAAYARFEAAIAPLAGGPVGDDNALWLDALRARLDDDDLFNISARILFEGRVAAALANGWQPGHHALFAAACQLFGWEKDRRRLQQFGYAGVVLNQAIDEQAMFETQPMGELDVQRKLLQRLRQKTLPNQDVLVRNTFYLEQLLARFPALAGIILDPDMVERWREAYRNLPPAPAQQYAQRQRPHQSAAPVPEPRLDMGASSNGSGNWLGGASGFLLVFLVIRLLMYFFSSTPERPPLRPVSEWPPQFEMRATTRPLPGPQQGAPDRPQAEPATPPAADLQPQAQRRPQPERFVPVEGNLFKDVSKRIVYDPPAGALPGLRKVEFRFKLDDKGRVASVKKLSASMDPAYDEAAEAALRASPPLPKHANATVTIWFSVELSLTPAPARPREPEESAAAPPDTQE